MNYRMIIAILGYILRVEGVLLFLPALVAVFYREWSHAGIFAVLGAVLLLLSFLMTHAEKGAPRKRIQMREGFVIVSFGWLLLSLGGALPFYFSGEIPSLVDCFFESASGFTTTGSTILTDVERLSYSLLFWRSFTHWIGGMGVLVFLLGLMPKLDASGVQLVKAESPGVMPGKLVPRLAQSSRILYGIYTVMTILLILLLVAAGMPFFDSVIHAMGTAGTGGYSMKNASIGAYHSMTIEMIIAVFMLLFGVNFNLYYFLVNRKWKDVLSNDEWKVYFLVVAFSVLFIMVNTLPGCGGSLLQAFRGAFFSVSSIITTTGYGTVDFNLWPAFSRFLMVLLMMVGACGGSTGGGLKVSRVIILFRCMNREINRILHPNQIRGVRSDGQTLDSNVVRQVLVFFFTYMMVIIGGSLLVSLDGFDLETTVTAVISAVSNIGPGLAGVGPVENYAAFSPLSKIVLSITMLTGRLELFPMLLLFRPSTWKKE